MRFNTTTYHFPFGYPEIEEGAMHHLSHVMEADTKVRALPDREFLGLYFHLSHQMEYEMAGIPPCTIGEGYYNIVYMPRGSCTLTLPKGIYTAFCIEFPLSYLKLIVTKFHVLKTLLIKASLKLPAVMSDEHIPITPSLRSKIDEVIQQKFSGDELLKGRFIDILFSCLEHSQRSFYEGLDKSDIEKINQAHDLMLKDIRLSWTVGLLADNVDISKRKLERGFKKLYGTTVYHFLTDERLKKAIALLRDTSYTATQISATVGYKRFTTFSDTFRRKFGYSPGALRKEENLE